MPHSIDKMRNVIKVKVLTDSMFFIEFAILIMICFSLKAAKIAFFFVIIYLFFRDYPF